MNLKAATVTDGYKVGHGAMYADGTTLVYSNLTPRSDKIYRQMCTDFYSGKLVWVGAQGAVKEIQELWDKSFFSQPKDVVVGRYATRMQGYLGGFDPAVEAMSKLWDVGFLPIEVKSLAEGSRVPMGVPVLTIRNTHPDFYWLTNYLEPLISNLTWKTATNATIADEYKAICKHYAEMTGTDDFSVSIQCHDFSMRGMSGPEDAARSGFAHLTQFIGTDTLSAMDYAEDYYDADPNGLIAISVPATEHAVATSNILKIEKDLASRGFPVPNEFADADDPVRLTAEMLFMKDLITRKFPTGIVSYVADSFDFWAVLTDILPALKDVILNREASHVAPGKLVIRPDSGDPMKVIAGYTWSGNVYESHEELRNATYNQFQTDWGNEHGWSKTCDIDKEVVNINGVFYKCWLDGHNYVKASSEVVPECEVKGAIQLLWETFGGTVTDKGYKLLDGHIGLIYGDSITTKRAEEILRRLADKGFASGNVVFGVGSYTYQCNTRDTFGFAVKATYTEVGNEKIAIFKDPKTDSKKKSAKGLLMVGYNTDGGLYLEDDVAPEQESSEDNKLQCIWRNGQWVKTTTLAEIRSRLA